MLKILAKIRVLIALMLILSACNDIENSVNPTQEQVKSEIKWKCDSNGNKLYKIYYKEYDKSGKIIKITEYSDLGKTTSIKVVNYSTETSKETINFFDSEGKIDSTIITTNSHGSGE